MISSVHLRALVVAINIAAATLVLASPLPPFEVAKTKRAVNCPATDSAGSALTGSSADPGDEFATCAYQTAGECTYFFAVRATCVHECAYVLTLGRTAASRAGRAPVPLGSSRTLRRQQLLGPSRASHSDTRDGA